MEILTKYGADGDTPDVRRAALRCVANALLLDEAMRQVFVDTGYGGKLAERLKVRISTALTSPHKLMPRQCDSSDDEMAISRILFLSTYDTTMDFENLIKHHSLCDNVNYVSGNLHCLHAK